jgi:cysteine sulfinate desulfinase/cysteine desulfurase-like protein
MRGAVRFSLGHGTSDGEIERALELIARAAQRLRPSGIAQ